jgi:hypothetical protein
MKTFILFLFGVFEDQEDIEYFCLDIFGSSDKISKVRYVIEKSQNIIIIFDSDSDYKTLSEEVYNLSFNDSVKFYFLVERDSLVSAHVPQAVKDFIFKPQTTDMFMKIEYEKSSPSMDLDELLEKIEKMGVDSLTPEEKNFLDNFEM